ncbi:MAG: hypothetical protein IPN97_12810 [Saprospiraceae bacterium]|nr:hypothetical protein [Saprospiraceae bacterium]
MMLKLLLLFHLTFFTIPSLHNKLQSFEVAKLYEGIILDRGVKIINSYDNVENAKLLLTPTQLQTCSYNVKVTRKAKDIYLIEGTKYYIETRFCFDYAFSKDVVLVIENNYGYNIGKLYL